MFSFLLGLIAGVCLAVAFPDKVQSIHSSVVSKVKSLGGKDE